MKRGRSKMEGILEDAVAALNMLAFDDLNRRELYNLQAVRLAAEIIRLDNEKLQLYGCELLERLAGDGDIVEEIRMQQITERLTDLSNCGISHIRDCAKRLIEKLQFVGYQTHVGSFGYYGGGAQMMNR